MGNNMLVKESIRYVIVTVERPITYLKKIYKDPYHIRYEFVDDITQATKTANRNDAKMLLKQFKLDVEVNGEEFVIIPVHISYELINESEE